MATEAQDHHERSGSQLLFWGAVGVILIFAFLWNQTAGARGFFALDQGLVMDGAWRVQQGQVPYVDFQMPMGLIPIVLVAAFFQVLGAGFDSYLLVGSLINVLGAWLVLQIGLSLLPERRAWILLATLASAICFHPAMGTPYVDQTAGLFVLVALTLVLRSKERPGIGSRLPEFAAGAAWVLAFLSKQSVALFALAALLPLFWWRSLGSRRILTALWTFSLGVVFAGVCLILWLITFSDFSTFVECSFSIPGGEGARRLAELPSIRSWLLHIPDPGPFTAFHVLSLLFFPLGCFWGGARRDRDLLVLSVLGLLSTISHAMLVQLANNGPYSLRTLFPLQLLILLEVVGRVLRGLHARPWARAVLTGAILLLAVITLLRSLDTAWRRRLHEPCTDASFSRSLDWPGWTSLNWAEPTRIHDSRYRIDDLQGLLAWLRQQDQPFFAWPDSTFLYCALRKPSPQPLLWFHPGLTYLRRDAPRIEARILHSLQRAAVRIVIVEQDYWMQEKHILEDFPGLNDWITTRFHFTRRFGPWLAYQR